MTFCCRNLGWSLSHGGRLPLPRAAVQQHNFTSRTSCPAVLQSAGDRCLRDFSAHIVRLLRVAKMAMGCCSVPTMSELGEKTGM